MPLPNVPFPLVNGNRFSYASIELSIDSQVFTGFSGISYQQSLEPSEVRGTGPQNMGFTRGDLKAEGSLDIYIEEDARIIAALGDGFYEKFFPVTVTYQEQGQQLITDSIPYVRFKSGQRSHQKGTDGLTVKRDLLLFYILENGVAPINNLQP